MISITCTFLHVIFISSIFTLTSHDHVGMLSHKSFRCSWSMAICTRSTCLWPASLHSEEEWYNMSQISNNVDDVYRLRDGTWKWVVRIIPFSSCSAILNIFPLVEWVRQVSELLSKAPSTKPVNCWERFILNNGADLPDVKHSQCSHKDTNLW